MSLRILTSLLVGAALGLAAPAAAESEGAVLGGDGSVLQLHSGTFAELFPDRADHDADAFVLALDVRRSGRVERLLVPGTESKTAETVATLLHEGASGLTYLLWEGILSGIHPVLYLTTWDGDAWGETLEVTGSPFTPKGDPRLVVTRDGDPIRDGADGERTILHLTWWEESVGALRWLYTPLVIADGRQLEERSVRELGSYLGFEAAPALVDGGFSSNLGLLQQGRDASTLVASFVEGGSLGTVEVEVVPQALSRLAADVAAEIAALDPGLSHDDALAAVRRAIFEGGRGFYPSTLVFLAEEIAAMLLEVESDYESASAGAGIHIIHIGMRLGTAGLDDGDASEILAIDDGASGAVHHLKLSTLASWALPEASEAASGVEPVLFVSRDGGDALLAWPLRHRVIYRESLEDGGWTGERVVRLDEDLDADMALDMLRARTADR